MARPALEVADLLRRVRQQGKLPIVSSAQTKVINALIACRTAVLGGHVDACDQCGHERISYNSCRNRHCPKCQGSQAAAWLDAQRATLLPVPYAHVVFTLPDLLGPLALQNPRVVYGLLFRAASQTLLQVAATPRHLGGRLGFLAILHTWGQNLLHHPHLHCVVPAGALASDGSRWLPCRPGFFLPVRVLSRLFRAKFLDFLGQAYRDDELTLHGQLHEFRHEAAFRALLARLRALEWVVYAKPPFGGPDCVLKYLARYTHRIAISNHRLLGVTNEQVSFTWKDYKRGHRQRVMTLDISEFVRRFLLHVLPDRFVKIRYYGLLAQSQRAASLAHCRRLLGTPPDSATSETSVSTNTDTIADALLCPKCQHGHLHRLRVLQPIDTS